MNVPKAADPEACCCKSLPSGCCPGEDDLKNTAVPPGPAVPSSDRENTAPPYYHREIF